MTGAGMMDPSTSPSPQPKSFQPRLPSPSLTTGSGYSLPSFSRPSSASATHRNLSSIRIKRNKPVVNGGRLRSNLSAPSSRSPSTTTSHFNMAEYAIDLEKLGEKDSGLTIGSGGQVLEPVSSHGEGPEDFTVNMEKWMRGTEKWRKAGGKEDEESEHEDEKNDDDTEEGMEDVDPRHEEGVLEDSEFVPLGTSTPAVFGSQRNFGEDSLKVSEKNVHQPPPLSRLNTEMIQNRAAEEVFDQISALQSEVERLRIEDQDSRVIIEALKRQCDQLRVDNDEIKAELRNVRNEALELQKETKLAEKSLALERKSREDAGSRVGSLRAKFDPVVQDLAIVRSTAESEKLAAEAKILTLDTKLQKLQEDNAKQQNDAHSTQQANTVEFQNLRSELDVCKGEIKAYQQALKYLGEDHSLAIASLNQRFEAAHASENKTTGFKTSLNHTNEQLIESERAVETVEAENNRLFQENERQSVEKVQLVSEIEKKNASIEDLESLVKDLKEEIEHIKAEKKAGGIEKSVREAEIDGLRRQFQGDILEVESSYDQQLKALKTAFLREGDIMRERETRLQKSYREEIAALNQHLITLNLKQRITTLTSEQQIRRLKLEPLSRLSTKPGPAAGMLSDELFEAKEDLLSVRQALGSTKASLAKTQNEMKDMEQKHQDENKALDEAMDRLVEERKTMVHALMTAWGREEMEPAKEVERQRYRYKFLKKREVSAEEFVTEILDDV